MKRFRIFVVLVGLAALGFALGSNQEAVRNLLGRSLISRTKSDTLSARELKQILTKKNLAPSVYPEQNRGRVEGFTLINVHTPYEGEIAKTDTFIAFDQIVANAKNLPKDKNAPIILYCKTDRMSAEALQTIRKLGYTNVRHLAGGMDAWQKTGGDLLDLSSLESEVLPAEGIELPVSWGDLGPKLIDLGVIDLAKFKEAVKLTPEQEEILTRGSEKKIRIDAANSQFVVDVLWALGLAQKSIVYEEGPMGKEYKKDVANFASTGGWTLARSDAIQYLNKFDLIKLAPQQQTLVGEIAKNVYRPCCGNPTWFPDCNHGMAALAAIELMVAAGLDETMIYKSVLALNTFWFPDTYLTIATHFARQGIPWSQVDPKDILGVKYSSGQGAAEVTRKVGPLPYKPESQGGGCGA